MKGIDKIIDEKTLYCVFFYIFTKGLGGSNYPLKKASTELCPNFFSTSHNQYNVETKKCVKCGRLLFETEFYKKGKSNSILRSSCIQCENNKVREYFLTKGGVVSMIYSTQKANSVKRNHTLPSYTREELKEWLFSQSLFHELYDDWVSSGYKRNLKPSVDRVFDNRGYSIDNIQLTTSITNARKQATLKRIGFKDDELKPVVAVSIGNGQITNFISIRSASRETGVSRSSISACCHKRKIKDGKGFYYTTNSAGGYVWMFKESFNEDTFSIGNPYHINQLRAIISIDDSGNKTEYPSTAEASRVTGIPRTTITSCLIGSIKCGKNRNLQWNYKE